MAFTKNLRRTSHRSPNEQGQIIIIVVVFFAIITAISATLLSYVLQFNQQERNAVGSNQALQLAEAGIDQSIYQLNQSSGYAGETNTALGPGSFTTTVTDLNASTKQIVSTASVALGNRTITRTVTAQTSVNTSVVSFRYGVQVGDGGITMNNGSKINGNLFSNGSATGSGTITGDLTVAAGTSTTADQQWTTQNSNLNLGDVSSRADLAESFKPSATNPLNKISLYIKKTGSPSNITIDLMSDNSGKPSKTILATGTLSASSVVGTYGFIDAGFNTLATINAGQTYWIMAIAPSISTSNYYTLGLDNTSGYVNGTGMSSPNWGATNPVWTAVGGNFDFKTWMGGVITSMSGLTVGGTARAHSISSCSVTGDAYYQTSTGCTIGGTAHAGAADTAPEPMPISLAEISSWEATAAAGGVIAGPYTTSGNVSLGPKEIDGDLTIGIGSTLTLTGPVWINGNMTMSNNSTLKVSAATGNDGAVVIADAVNNQSGSGVISVSNNAIISGNGNPNSFPMFLSTNSSSNAIIMNNNSSGVILYAANGYVTVSNNSNLNELTAYGITLSNNAQVTYVAGLQSQGFSDGPGGSWEIIPGTYAITK